MEKRELAIWKGICDALCEPIQNKRLWKPECETCSRYDHIEGTGCFLDKCKLTGESTWIKKKCDMSIEERAIEYVDKHKREIYSWEDLCTYRATQQAQLAAYAKGAEEQKAIDDANLLKLKSAWEKEAQTNHDDVANRKQGYHDAIEEAYKWIKANTEGGVHPQNAYGFADRFLKEMEE